jgi:tetratricopeptide (TPR) repeat protein
VEVVISLPARARVRVFVFARAPEGALRPASEIARCALVCLCLLAVLASAGVVRAQEPIAVQARAAFERGVAASRDGRWDDARLEFQRSRTLVVKPSTLFNLAVASLKLGRASEALEALAAFVQIANPAEHAAMLERAAALRADAERLEDAARPAGERVRALLEPAGLTPAQRTTFAAGRDAYARGDDKLALDAFSQAYEQSGRAELLYDMGVVCDRLREDERAIDAFRAFIEQQPQAPEAELARRRIERLEQVLRERSQPEQSLVAAEASTAPEPTRSPALPDAPPPPSLRAPRTLIVLGAAFAAASIGSGLWWADRNRASDACEARTPHCENADQINRQGSAAIGLTLAFDAAAITLMASGGAWLARRKRAARIALGPGLRLTF